MSESLHSALVENLFDEEEALLNLHMNVIQGVYVGVCVVCMCLCSSITLIFFCKTFLYYLTILSPSFSTFHFYVYNFLLTLLKLFCFVSLLSFYCFPFLTLLSLSYLTLTDFTLFNFTLLYFAFHCSFYLLASLPTSPLFSSPCDRECRVVDRRRETTSTDSRRR
jgi:hypothetical protein